MFRKHNKKIITAILVVIVTIGLIGPGVLLIFENFLAADYSPSGAQTVLPRENQISISDKDDTINFSTSSPETKN